MINGTIRSPLLLLPKPFSLADLLLVGFLVLSGGTSWLIVRAVTHSGTEVAVYVENQRRYVFSLRKDSREIIEGTQGNMVLEIHGGQVRVIESSCPLKICVKMGAISSPGRAIVCLPNKVVIVIEGDRQSDWIDAVTQ
jgi:hypothetical protein